MFNFLCEPYSYGLHPEALEIESLFHFVCAMSLESTTEAVLAHINDEAFSYYV